jgi:hypothetical protein
VRGVSFLLLCLNFWVSAMFIDAKKPQKPITIQDLYPDFSPAELEEAEVTITASVHLVGAALPKMIVNYQ